MAHAEPGDLDQRGPHPRVTRLRHALVTSDLAAMPRCRRKICMGRNLPPIVEATTQSVGAKDGSKFRPNTLEV